MFVYNNKSICIYFGDDSDKLFLDNQTYATLEAEPQLLEIYPFSQLHCIKQINNVYFPRQTHGTSGFAIDNKTINTIRSFSLQGDYTITNTPGIGLGVLTADCLPVLLHDKKNQAIAAIHAGWRGTVANIVIKAIDHMALAFGTIPADVSVFFGPAAGQCCYSVGQEVVEAVAPYRDLVLRKRDDEFFFDLQEYNRILLQNAHVPKASFHNRFAQCTICNKQFCSYRRQQQAAGRQMTVICLKKQS